MFTFSRAVRKQIPMLVSVAGTSGGGKTYSSLLLAAGMAGPKGTVGLLDTENGRGSLYVDSPGIVKALPNGFAISQMDAPFTPARYIEAIEAAEKAGLDVLVIDSTTHEWEGIGGCCDIAENNRLKGMPNWSMAKREHKRFVNHCLSSSMHIVFCLRARDKVKIVKEERGKDQFIPIGIQPITEKNFVFEMLVSLLLDEATHAARPLKVPEPLVSLFRGDGLITVEHGARIREWNEGAAVALDLNEQLAKRARAEAERGMAAYSKYFSEELTPHQRKWLTDSGHHKTNKDVAAQADAEAEAGDPDRADPPAAA